MKQRLLVMNGQRLLQSELGRKWETIKVEKAGAVKPGIYNIHLSAMVDKAVTHDGPILHADSNYIYQHVGNSLMKHDLNAFARLPDLGSHCSVTYVEGKAVVAPSPSSKAKRSSE